MRLSDADGPLSGAHLQIEAFMSHPGMAPVAADVQDRGGGEYRARLRFTMPGDWVMRVRGVQRDGRTFQVQHDVPSVRTGP